MGDSWTKIDYSKTAEEWMKPLVRGEEIDLVKIGGNWYLDDLPPMMFIKTSPDHPRLRQPARHRGAVARRVRLGLPRDGLRDVLPDHPPRRVGPAAGLLMLERLIEYINGHDGVRWATMEEIADDFVQRYPRSQPNHDPGINMYGIETPAAEGASS